MREGGRVNKTHWLLHFGGFSIRCEGGDPEAGQLALHFLITLF